MPSRLRGLKLSKVDLVDRGAQGSHATVRLFKRDHSGGKSEPATVKSRNPGTSETNHTDKEQSVGKLSEEVRKSLDPEVAEFIENLETELAEAREQSPEGEGAEEPALTKSELPEEVRELLAKRDEELEDLRKRATEAENIAKKEEVARRTREWTDRLNKFDAVGLDTEAVAKQFLALEDKDAELAEGLVETLKALNEQAKTANLFEEVGKKGPAEGSAEAQLEGIVKSYQADDGLTEHEAWERALREHRDLYDRYRQEA